MDKTTVTGERLEIPLKRSAMSIDIQRKHHTSKQRGTTASMPAPPTSRQSVWLRPWRKHWVFALAIIAVVAIGAALIRANVSPRKVSSLLTHTVTRGALSVTITEEGTLESASNKEIKCQVKGGSTILWIVRDGTQVEPGDELVRLDASTIEDEVSQQKITYETTVANKIQAESDLAVAKINITEYLEGTFRKEMKTAESNVAIAEENLRVAQNVFDHSKKLFRKGYISELELDGNQYSVDYARLQLELAKTEVDVLERFTKPKMLQELQSALKAATAKLASEEAALELEEGRLKRLEEQRDGCQIHADSSGMVIYPETDRWRNVPAIEEGSTVREQQTLLQIPDVSKMQVKVAVHESKVRQLKPG
jgi:multidrug efflux pump subunit AcrA (membrane-fusion protein)